MLAGPPLLDKHNGGAFLIQNDECGASIALRSDSRTSDQRNESTAKECKMAFVVNYSKMAELVLKELVKSGKLKRPDTAEVGSRLEWYKEWLESYVVALLFEELDRRGAVAGYVRILDASVKIRDKYLMEYLMQVIPDYEGFLRRSVNQAGKALMGNNEPGIDAPTKKALFYNGTDRRDNQGLGWTN
jgi:hypothetical protein